MFRLGWWEAGEVGAVDSCTMCDLQEGYAGGRHGVILPSPARCVWILPKNRAACLRAIATGVGQKLEGWEDGMVVLADNSTVCDLHEGLACR